LKKYKNLLSSLILGIILLIFLTSPLSFPNIPPVEQSVEETV